MRKPIIAAIMLGLVWRGARPPKVRDHDWERLSYEFDKRLPGVLAGLKSRHPKPRKPRRRPEAGGVPVEPNRPNTLSGGAAAALEFDPN